MFRARLSIGMIVLSAVVVAWVGCEDGGDASYYTPGEGGQGGTLQTGKGVGETCTDDIECRPGLICDDTSGTCQPGHSTEQGGDCVISAECEDGLYCEGGQCAQAGEGVEGDACVTDADCASGFRCSLVGLTATCVPEGDVDLGGACSESTDCFGGLACVEGACAQLPPGYPPFGMPWEGVVCEDETGPAEAHFHVPRGDDSDRDFFRLPFPNDVRLDNGQLDLTGFPTPGDALLGFDLVQRYVDAVTDTRDGWGMASGIYFRFSDGLDTETFADNVKLVDLTTGQGMGLHWAYSVGATKYICNYRVIIGRSQGRVFEPGHTYATYLLTGVKAHDDTTIERSDDLEALLGATEPTDPALAPHWPKYEPLRTYLADNTINPNTILTASVFTIGQPRSLVEQIQGVIDGGSPPTATQWTLCDTGVPSPCPDDTGDRACGPANADYFELHALVELPIFQQGTPPYVDPPDGGDLKQNGGVPEADHTEQICMALTVPKGTVPPNGWDTVVFAHGSGGQFRSHIESGLATDFAQGVDDGQGTIVKAAVLGIDQVLHGPRRAGSTLSANDLFFNFANPKAALGNPQQGAAEQMALLRFVPTVTFDQQSSPTNEAFSLSSNVGYWGHSLGALTGAIATPYGDWMGVLFTGQGALLRDSLVTKTSPVNIAGLIGFILEDFGNDGSLHHGARHPVLNLMQHYIDGGDPIAYGRLLAVAPPTSLEARHIFQLYGLSDTFTPSRVQANYVLAAGLDLVDHDSSAMAPEDIGNLTPVATPASGNLVIAQKTVSAFVREYGPMSADGHFVAFDVGSARADALRFLAGVLSGVTPQVGQ